MTIGLVTAILAGRQSVSLLRADTTAPAEPPAAERQADEADQCVERGPLQQRAQEFLQSLIELYDEIVAQLGEPQPEKEWGAEAAKDMDPRLRRVSHGFFEDMQALMPNSTPEEIDVDGERERMRGMSSRINRQFRDVAGLLQEFEDEKYGRRD